MKLILARPVAQQFKISSKFGLRVIDGKSEFHKGIDFACPVGTPVYAAVNGIAQRVGWENPSNPKTGYGLRVMQRFYVDSVMFFCWYGHLNEILIKEGEKIKEGQLLAYSGNTGRSTGPHLHFGARKSDTQDFYDIEFAKTLNVDSDKDNAPDVQQKGEACA